MIGSFQPRVSKSDLRAWKPAELNLLVCVVSESEKDWGILDCFMPLQSHVSWQIETAWKASKAKEKCLVSRVFVCRIVFVIGEGEHIPVCTWLHRGG